MVSEKKKVIHANQTQIETPLFSHQDLYEKSINQVPKIIRALKKYKFQMTTVADCVGDPNPYGQPHLLAQSDGPSNQTDTDHALPLAVEDFRIAAAAVVMHDQSPSVPRYLDASQQNSNAVPLDESDANSSDKSSSTPHSVSSTTSSASSTLTYSHIFSSLMTTLGFSLATILFD
jgi:hypothetical protein